jgi:hypothetical protein
LARDAGSEFMGRRCEEVACCRLFFLDRIKALLIIDR